jgi:hypothetical protein
LLVISSLCRLPAIVPITSLLLNFLRPRLWTLSHPEIAIAAFDCTNPDEQADVLALMLSNPRA